MSMNMLFWILAVVIPSLSALVLLWPLLRAHSGLLGAGAALVLLIPVSTLMLYQLVGSPAGIAVNPTGASPASAQQVSSAELPELLQQLQQRLEQEPNNLEGWILLGRSYKSMQQYGPAREALQQAYRLAPTDPDIMVELAEAMIFTSTGERINPEVQALLEQAVAANPAQQKGLWLLGIIAAQAGDDAQALQYWDRLLTLLEPGSEVAASVAAQAEAARGRLGLGAEGMLAGEAGPKAGVAAPLDDETGSMASEAEPMAEVPVSSALQSAGVMSFSVQVQTAAGLPDLSAESALFIIVRDPDNPRPPLGAKRIAQPVFPLSAQITDADSMLSERPISGAARVEILARLSLSGQPIAGPGDLESASVLRDSAATSAEPILLELTH